MKTTSTILICGSLATIFVAGNGNAHEHEYKSQHLKGAVQTASSTDFYNVDTNTATQISNYEALSDDSRYTYQFRVDLSTPLLTSSDGEPIIDSCIKWQSGDSSTNFTWYGISFQLPEDAKGGDGSWNNAPAQAVKEDGYLQLFNETSEGVAKYNFTTTSDRPVIRARINDGLFWETFTFDFTDESSNYVEQLSTRSILCIVHESDDGTQRILNDAVRPTLTASLERLSGPPAPTPQPEPSSSSMARSFFAISTLAASAFHLM